MLDMLESSNSGTVDAASVLEGIVVIEAGADVVGLEEANLHGYPPIRKTPGESSPGAFVSFQYRNF